MGPTVWKEFYESTAPPPPAPLDQIGRRETERIDSSEQRKVLHCQMQPNTRNHLDESPAIALPVCHELFERWPLLYNKVVDVALNVKPNSYLLARSLVTTLQQQS